MTPEEKAVELVTKFMQYEPIKLSDYTRIEYPSAINLAKIVVDEIINTDMLEFMTIQMPLTKNYYEYWKKVKQKLDYL